MTFLEEFEKRASILAQLIKQAQDPMMAGGAPAAAPMGMDPMAAMGGGMSPMGGAPMGAPMDPAMMGMMGGMPPVPSAPPGQPMDPAMLEQLLGAPVPEEEEKEDLGADGEKVLTKALDLVEKVVDLALTKDEESAPENAAATLLASGAADNVSPNEIMELADTVGQEPEEIPQLS